VGPGKRSICATLDLCLNGRLAQFEKILERTGLRQHIRDSPTATPRPEFRNTQQNSGSQQSRSLQIRQIDGRNETSRPLKTYRSSCTKHHKEESSLAIQIRTGKIGLGAFLLSKSKTGLEAHSDSKSHLPKSRTSTSNPRQGLVWKPTSTSNPTFCNEA
jgi:hypothetical protein